MNIEEIPVIKVKAARDIAARLRALAVRRANEAWAQLKPNPAVSESAERLVNDLPINEDDEALDELVSELEKQLPVGTSIQALAIVNQVCSHEFDDAYQAEWRRLCQEAGIRLPPL